VVRFIEQLPVAANTEHARTGRRRARVRCRFFYAGARAGRRQAGGQGMEGAGAKWRGWGFVRVCCDGSVGLVPRAFVP
jgi:hypothetical protein